MKIQFSKQLSAVPLNLRLSIK